MKTNTNSTNLRGAFLLSFVMWGLAMTGCSAQSEGKRYTVVVYNYTDFSIDEINFNAKPIGSGYVKKARHEELIHEGTGEKIIVNYTSGGSYCCRQYPLMKPGDIFPVTMEKYTNEGGAPINTWAYVKMNFRPEMDTDITLHVYPDWHIEVDGDTNGRADNKPPEFKPDAQHQAVIGPIKKWEKKDE